MTESSTTIRVAVSQRERLRALAELRGSSMTSTLDAALDALKREVFYSQMAEAESRLQADPKEWNAFIQERDEWLEAPVESS